MDSERLLSFEHRIRQLEINEAANKTQIDNLIITMNNLMAWIKALVITILPAFGYLSWLALHK